MDRSPRDIVLSENDTHFARDKDSNYVLLFLNVRRTVTVIKARISIFHIRKTIKFSTQNSSENNREDVHRKTDNILALKSATLRSIVGENVFLIRFSRWTLLGRLLDEFMKAQNPAISDHLRLG